MPMVHGDEVIKGVPGTGSRIDMYFEDPAGSKTGKLFPTGKQGVISSMYRVTARLK